MRDPMDVHAAYRRILDRPEMRQIAARFGLDRGVRYEFVSERRSFHGKAGTVAGQRMVRLPSNSRPEAYLMLTVLHEWAHLLVEMRKPRAHVLPHGPEWVRQYVLLTAAAVNAGLFPDNEVEVMRHAAAGEVRTIGARLRGPDGRLLAPAAERQVAEFQVGEHIRFTDQHGHTIAGTIRRVNQRSYTIATSDGARIYRVGLGYPSLARAEAPFPAAAPAPSAMPAPAPAPRPPVRPPAIRWRAGMAVTFTDAHGVPKKGTVVRVNPKTLTVNADDGMQYRVGYGHPQLRPAEGGT